MTKRGKVSVRFGALVVLLIAPAYGQLYTYSELWGFGNGSDGSFPYGSVIADSARNLYGTTSSGGTFSGCGTVFELSPTSGGLWKEKILLDFDESGGCSPYGALVMDKAGNLYGTASIGGGANSLGVVYEVSPNSNGTWTETVLHNFVSTNGDGYKPISSLIFDAIGNLYGTTTEGGAKGCSLNPTGTVFELSPTAGSWNETVLWTFCQEAAGGAYPDAGVVFDSAGNLYGTTTEGGIITGYPCSPNGCGTVFELSPGTNGWTEKVLHSFAGGTTDGDLPYGGVILDTAGNLYGTTQYCGKNGYDIYSGTAYELSPQSNGTWKEKILHNFGTGTDGSEPLASLILQNGNLYGTTSGGGKNNGGTLFALLPGSNGNWTERIIYNFNHSSNDCTNGCYPADAVIFDSKGNIYGTTENGGTNGGRGTVFEFRPGGKPGDRKPGDRRNWHDYFIPM